MSKGILYMLTAIAVVYLLVAGFFFYSIANPQTHSSYYLPSTEFRYIEGEDNSLLISMAEKEGRIYLASFTGTKVNIYEWNATGGWIHIQMVAFPQAISSDAMQMDLLANNSMRILVESSDMNYISYSHDGYDWTPFINTTETIPANELWDQVEDPRESDEYSTDLIFFNQTYYYVYSDSFMVSPDEMREMTFVKKSTDGTHWSGPIHISDRRAYSVIISNDGTILVVGPRMFTGEGKVGYLTGPLELNEIKYSPYISPCCIWFVCPGFIVIITLIIAVLFIDAFFQKGDNLEE